MSSLLRTVAGTPRLVRESDKMFGEANQLSLFEEVQRERPELAEDEVIITLCERLLSEAEAEPPIPVERIASLRGIVRVETREQPWAGILEPRGSNFVVGVRSSDGYARRRFTVCHESGHTLFPGFAQQRQFRCDGERSRLEQRCDFAASELLLPRRFFSADLQDAEFGLEAVEDLASEYQASIEATALRLAGLWPGPSLVLVLRKRHKPAERGREDECEPKLRLDYSVASGSWPYMLRHKSVTAGSPFGRAYEGELVDDPVASLGALATSDAGPVEVHARRYGGDGRVLALVRPATRSQRG